MHYLIELQSHLDQIDLTQGHTYLEFIYGNDNTHPLLSEIIAVYIKPQDNKGYIIPINHPEALNWDKDVVFKWLEQGKFWVKDKKAALHTHPTLHYTDIQSIYYFHTNTPLSDTYNTSAHAWYYRKFPQIKANKIIPLGKHYERCEARQCELSQVISTYGNESYKLYNDKILPTLYKLEKESINTNNKFDSHFKLKCKKYSIQKNRIYGQYNPYTTTGRPVNNFNGINLVGLQHGNGERDCFEPTGAFFVEMDYDGYHPRLIGEMVGFSFGKKGVHNELASVYFGTDKPTPEQYKEGKKLTFQQIYGGIKSDYLKHEFFEKTQEYIDLNWELFNAQGYIETEGGRRIWKKNHENIHKQKLFNYLIQAYETETNIKRMIKLQEFLNDKGTSFVLYVYDAFIFDLDKEDGKEIIKDIKEILSDKFPVKIKAGPHYGALV